MMAGTRITSPLELGAALRQERRRLRLSQSDVALAANTGTRFISELENGKSTSQIGETLRVIGALGLDVQLVPRGR